MYVLFCHKKYTSNRQRTEQFVFLSAFFLLRSKDYLSRTHFPVGGLNWSIGTRRQIRNSIDQKAKSEISHVTCQQRRTEMPYWFRNALKPSPWKKVAREGLEHRRRTEFPFNVHVSVFCSDAVKRTQTRAAHAYNVASYPAWSQSLRHTTMIIFSILVCECIQSERATSECLINKCFARTKHSA